MFPHNRGRIAAPERLAKRSLQRAIGLSLLLAVLTPLLTPLRSDASSFERDTFNHIVFTGSCSEQQWSVRTDDSLVLIMAPSSSGPCEATLDFYSPPRLTLESALHFEARSSSPGPFLKIGIKENPGDPVIYSTPFPKQGLSKQWKPDGARMRFFKEGWMPRLITSLHVVVLPNPNQPHGTYSTVSLRDFRLVSQGAAAAAPAKTEPLASLPTVATQRPPIASPRPMVADVTKSPNMKILIAPFSRLQKALLLLAGILMAGLAIPKRSQRRRVLSPMYELNMRTWKTHRDPNGVVQYGGFKKISLADLKAIKQSGFNALWLMGIWEIGPKVRAISKNYSEDFHGSPFAIQDYQVSSDLGSEQEFRDLVQRAHSLRLMVMVDFIPNHMGLDSDWLNDHPEYFIHRVLNQDEAQLPDEVLLQRYPGHFPYRTPAYPQGASRVPKTIMVAYGKDPYFYPWIDTAQLDYAQSALRQKMIEVLAHWAHVVDGVRCDMAMLMVREQVKIHRHPDMSWDTFNQLMPNEFWTEAIQAIKRVNPNFVFMAETYWSMEGHLQNIGFDYTYNKPLYEAICSALHSGHAEGLLNFLRLLGSNFLQKGVHFLENHDEERAMNALGEEKQKAAAAILCTLPGIALLHHGQMEGRRERMPVQRVIPLHQEADHTSLSHYYRRLLKATARPVFQIGRLIPLYSNNSALACYARVSGEEKVMVVVNTSAKRQSGNVFLIPGLHLSASSSYRLQDLFFELKASNLPSVQPSYSYSANQLMNKGLYVELDSFDAHIFVVEPQGALHATQRSMKAIQNVMDEWPVNRLVRRLGGVALTRSSDTNLAANPASRQQ